MIDIVVKCILKVGNQYFLQITIDVNGEPTVIQVAIPTHVALLLKQLGIPDCCIASTQTFSNTTPIVTPNVGVADPYPSQIVVDGMSGIIEKITVTLKNINSTWPDDIDVLLVGPQGQTLILMSDVGGGNDIGNVTLIFDDDVENVLPDSGQLVSGTFKPANYAGAGSENWPAPAPAPIPPYGNPALGQGLNVFNGTDPNGTWSVYVVDDNTQDTSSITGGWELTITTSCPE